MRAVRLALLPAALCFAFPAVAQDAGPPDTMPTVTVRGDGSVQLKPDYARVTVSVITRAASLREATDNHGPRAARALALIQGLKDRGVAVERSDFTLQQENPSALDAAAPSEAQFMADTTFILKVDALDKLDSDLGALVDSGMVEVSASVFEIKDPAAAVNDARRAALVGASRSAEAYADAGHFRLLGLQKVLDVTPQNFASMAASPLVERARSESVAIVPPQRLSFRASVIATWRIAPR